MFLIRKLEYHWKVIFICSVWLIDVYYLLSKGPSSTEESIFWFTNASMKCFQRKIPHVCIIRSEFKTFLFNFNVFFFLNSMPLQNFGNHDPSQFLFLFQLWISLHSWGKIMEYCFLHGFGFRIFLSFFFFQLSSLSKY